MFDKVGESALLHRVQIELAESQKEIYGVEEGIALINRWSDYYEKVTRELEVLQNQALSMYAKKYGSLFKHSKKIKVSVWVWRHRTPIIKGWVPSEGRM